ncbi:MAG TPA: AAA family ATPase [Candidatus Limnocylindrales bacterium]|nr:AAA family ATPase [Candidatus Limnocylindrales bacterium]
MGSDARQTTREAIVGHPSLEAPFVGRAAELETLLGALDDALGGGRPRYVLVDGAAGIGKSRLVREFLSKARSRASAAAILQGRCPASGRGVSYWALGEVLRRACGIGLDDRADDTEARLREGLARILAPLGLSPAEAEETLHALATSAGIVIPGNPLERVEPRVVPPAIARAWARFLGAHARRGGAILLIEDLHWAGSALVSALPAIASMLDGPVLVVGTARPAFLGRQPDFMADHGLATVGVSPLGPDVAASLVDALVPPSALPDELRSTVVARAEGNPFFLEEAVRHLVETGTLRPSDGEPWQVRTRGAPIPDSLQAVLVARIQALPLAERRVIQEAAVVGRVFWEGPIRRALGLADVREELGRLAERGLVFTRPTSSLSGEVELSFKHALVRDAAYGTMTTVHRARSHASVAAWLEGIADDPTAELGGLIGEHLKRAIEQDPGGTAWPDPAEREHVRARAVRYLLAAGASAHRRFAIDKAVELDEAALRLATSDAERARALTSLGEAHESGLSGPPAVDAYRRALAAAERAALPADERARICLAAARTMAIRWGAFPVRPHPAEIDEFIDEGLALAEDAETRLWLLAMKGAAGMRWDAAHLSDPEFVADRSRAVNAAIDGARQLGLTDLVVVAGRLSGQLEFAAGRFAASGAVFRDLVPHLPKVESVFQRALTSMYVTQALADVVGAYADALEVARTVLELGRKLSPHEHAHGTASMLWSLYHLGEWAETAPLVEEHLRAVRGADVFVCSYMRSGPLVGALIAGHLGEFERARELLAEVAMSDDAPGFPEALRARVLVTLGEPEAGAAAALAMIEGGRLASLEENEHEAIALIEALHALGDWERLRAFLPDARRRSASLAILGPICDRAEGLVAAADGDTERAIQCYRTALAGFERFGVRYEIARTEALLANVLPDGDAMLAEAIATAESLFRGPASPAAPVALPSAMPAPWGGPAPTGAAGAPKSSAGASESPLTEREREILRLIGEGIDNRAIAEQLVLSHRTVERHVSNIYVKLGLEGRAARAAAASYAVRSGLTD